MKKYTLNILPKNDGNTTGFVGEVVMNGSVVFSTKIVPDPMIASKEMQKFLTSQHLIESPSQTRRHFNTINYSASSQTRKIISKGSCCG